MISTSLSSFGSHSITHVDVELFRLNARELFTGSGISAAGIELVAKDEPKPKFLSTTA